MEGQKSSVVSGEEEEGGEAGGVGWGRGCSRAPVHGCWRTRLQSRGGVALGGGHLLRLLVFRRLGGRGEGDGRGAMWGLEWVMKSVIVSCLVLVVLARFLLACWGRRAALRFLVAGGGVGGSGRGGSGLVGGGTGRGGDGGGGGIGGGRGDGEEELDVVDGEDEVWLIMCVGEGGGGGGGGCGGGAGLVGWAGFLSWMVLLSMVEKFICSIISSSLLR